MKSNMQEVVTGETPLGRTIMEKMARPIQAQVAKALAEAGQAPAMSLVAPAALAL